MPILSPENLGGYLTRLFDAKKANDNELLFKLLVLNQAPTEIHGFMSRVAPHKKFLAIISHQLKGEDVYFAGDLSVYKKDIFQLNHRGASLVETGYKQDLEHSVAVHSLLGIIFSQIEDNRFTLSEL